jgi:pyruvate/2-oxoglutarate dehydrogenase complex dihydrolipoamide dehydrogenase (E3) component
MAGTTAASYCSSKGLRVSIIDSMPYGGTCALLGCEIKKRFLWKLQKQLIQTKDIKIKGSATRTEFV